MHGWQKLFQTGIEDVNGFFAPVGVALTFVLFGAAVALPLAGPGAFALDHASGREATGDRPRTTEAGVSA